ncbi:MAG: DNA repair protein RecN [Dehalococcoidia bacterium]
MIETLTIRNFAVARDVTVRPGSGLAVFTGETGAGKSLIVDALDFVFGGRYGREVIASGADRATVEAVVVRGRSRVTVERSIGLAGRSVARVDGDLARVEQLAALAAETIDIHSQSEQLSVLRPAVQLAALDAYAGLDREREAMTRLARELRDVRRRIRALSTDARERERLLDQLRFEVEEIEAAALVPGEDEQLRAELSRLANVQHLIEDATAAMVALDGPGVAEALQAVHDLCDRDPSAGELADTAALLETAAADLARALRRYRDALEDDPERLAYVQERLDLIARLRRKYGETVDDVLAYAQGAREQLATLSVAEESLEELHRREAELAMQAGALAQELAEARRVAASRLVAAVASELLALGMGAAGLAIGFACEDADDGLPVALPDYEVVAAGREALPPVEERHARAFGETGVDRVEFLAAFNPGESPRPLSAVASGGETSRFLLALTAVLSATSSPRTIVLDEVDEGVGGRAGGLVGEALRRLARRHQVLCVTHLPQVAAYGDQHFVVTKQTDGARTWSEVCQVEGETRVEELASMLGGATEANCAAARELLAAAAAATP